jgi:uncharacterized protein (DUF2141 family)
MWRNRWIAGVEGLEARTFLSQTPFLGSPVLVGTGTPAWIEYENYDLGGEGIAFHVEKGFYNSTHYRPDNARIVPFEKASNGFALAGDAASAGSWTEYTVAVATAGTYRFALTSAMMGSGATAHFDVDGARVTENFAFPRTNTWADFRSMLVGDSFALSQGQHVIRLTLDSTLNGLTIGIASIDSFQLVPVTVGSQQPFDGAATSITASGQTVLQLEDFDLGGEGVAYHDTTTANTGNDYRISEGVDIRTTADGHAVTDLANGEWLKYTIDVAAKGNYSVTLKSGSAAGVWTASLELDGVRLSNDLAIPDTGSIDNMTEITLHGLQLPSGKHVLRLTFHDDSAHSGAIALDHLQFSRESLSTVSISAPASCQESNAFDGSYFLIYRTGPIDTDLWVNFIITSPAEFHPLRAAGLAQGVKIPAGKSVVSFRTGAYDDIGPEFDHTIVATLQPDDFYVFGSQNKASTVIHDDDVKAGDIVGRVFDDLNGNGKMESNEPGIYNAIVYLDINKNNHRESTERTFLTTWDGEYYFRGLGSGTHRLAVEVPTGLKQTLPANGGLSIPLNGYYVGANFGLRQTSLTGKGSISGTVFHDVDGDAVKDTNEPGIAGRTVFIDSNSNWICDELEISTTTDSNGKYTLSKLPAGAYKVRAAVPTGWIQTAPGKSYPQTVTLADGASATGRNFGEMVSGSSAKITGTVFNDADRDGAWDDGEKGIAARTVYIDLDNDVVLDANEQLTLTDSSGYFAFENLKPGTYKVRQVLPAGWKQTTPSNGYGWNVTVIGGAVAAGKNFGASQPLVSTASISGTVFNDKDADAIKDTNEAGLAGRTVYIDLDNDSILDAKEVRVITDSNGNYKFTGLAAGTYKVRQVLPSGWMQTTPSKGYGWNVSLTSGQSATNRHFGSR